MLSNRQQEVLKFIKSYAQKHLHSPTQREIQKTLNINSCSFLNRTLARLESLGYLERKSKRARNNLQLCHSPYSLPLIGRIAAGAPIEAINQPEEIVITDQLLGDNRYMLEVKGDSMIEDNICDGDWVICERCQKTPNGTIVVALIHQHEATLKRIYYDADRIRLEPANKNYQAQIYPADEVSIQGKFIGLIRLKTK
jgi:repressor LexA